MGKKTDKRSPREIARANKAARRAFETGSETKGARNRTYAVALIDQLMTTIIGLALFALFIARI